MIKSNAEKNCTAAWERGSKLMIKSNTKKPKTHAIIEKPPEPVSTPTIYVRYSSI